MYVILIIIYENEWKNYLKLCFILNSVFVVFFIGCLNKFNIKENIIVLININLQNNVNVDMCKKFKYDSFCCIIKE